jgi:hypothetical protein
MTNTDLPVLYKTLAYVAKGLKEDFSADRLDFYAEMLWDLEIGDICAAIGLSARTSPFFPKPADIRRIAGGTVAPMDAAEQAWERFRYALQHVTVYDTVDFGDSTLHAVIRSMFGGWPQTLQIESAKIHFTRTEFLRSYVSLSKLGGHSPEPLIGLMPGGTVVMIAISATPTPPMPMLISLPDLGSERQGDMVPLREVLTHWHPSTI